MLWFFFAVNFTHFYLTLFSETWAEKPWFQANLRFFLTISQRTAVMIMMMMGPKHAECSREACCTSLNDPSGRRRRSPRLGVQGTSWYSAVSVNFVGGFCGMGPPWTPFLRPNCLSHAP